MSIKLIAFLHESTLRIFIVKGSGVENLQIDYPESVVKGSDIYDLEKFGFDLKTQLIKRPDLKGSEILFLIPPEKALCSVFPLKGSNLEAVKNRFYTQISQSPEETLLKITHLKGEVSLTAYPKKLLTDIDTVLAKISFKALFLPLGELVALGFGSKETSAIFFDIDGHTNTVISEKNHLVASSELNSKKVGEITESLQTLKKENFPKLETVFFLSEHPQLAEDVEKAGFKIGELTLEGDFFKNIIDVVSENLSRIIKNSFDTSTKEESQLTKKVLQKTLQLFMLLFFFGLTFGVFFLFKDLAVFVTKPPREIANNTSPIASDAAAPKTATVSATPTLASVSKNQLTVLVLNGNGIPGNAGFLKTKLAGDGFGNITTDTADSQGQRDTIVKLGSRVSPSVKDDLNTLLSSNYVSVVFSTSAPTGVDIEITTGAR